MTNAGFERLERRVEREYHKQGFGLKRARAIGQAVAGKVAREKRAMARPNPAKANPFFGFGAKPKPPSKTELRVVAERKRTKKARVAATKRAWETADRKASEWQDRHRHADTPAQAKRALTQFAMWQRRLASAERAYDAAFAEAKRVGAV